ncbi:unnamed protein product [Caenorhabditis auriculariae]|uniref:Aromatic amino acid beta-eliminating lyase/threonine aldolase domain-containing protein n=1 Tax=Caenorhabditis auriculariae TaxID=2777116 RepID=A0A8S1H791_9PELO|nr:unnamed protein product [Caenorhabditis auriculariae]
MVGRQVLNRILGGLSLRARLERPFAAMSAVPENKPGYTQRIENSAECVDLRSDTVTLPSVEMRRAMAEAVLGDDVYGEDPTVNALEQRCAKLFGKEAALFVLSGTMGNLLAVMVHCQRGDELIVGRHHHIHRWEQGNYAQIAGVSATTLDVKSDGTLDLKDVEDSIRVKDAHMPMTRLICVENTHNFMGGKAIPIDHLKALKELAVRKGLKIHMDGARIYNAAVATNCEVSEIASYADTVQMCFSKGLGAPSGSILVGSREEIALARLRRKALGGGWRQAGILAAAAMVALDHAEATVRKDHERAKILASAINKSTPAALKKKIFANDDTNITNMVLLNCLEEVNVYKVMEFFKSNGVLVMAFDSTRIRMVLNWGVDDEGLRKVVDVYKKLVGQLAADPRFVGAADHLPASPVMREAYRRSSPALTFSDQLVLMSCRRRRPQESSRQLFLQHWLRKILPCCCKTPVGVDELTDEEMHAVREVWSRAKQRDIGMQILRELIDRKPQFKDYFGIHVSNENMEELYACKEFLLQAHRIQNFLDTAVSSLGFCPMVIVQQMAHRVGQIHYYRGVNFGADNWLSFKKVTVESVTSELRSEPVVESRSSTKLSLRESVQLSQLIFEVDPRLAVVGWEKFMGSIVQTRTMIDFINGAKIVVPVVAVSSRLRLGAGMSSFSFKKYVQQYWCCCVYPPKTHDPTEFLENNREYRAIFGLFHVKDAAIGLAIVKTVALLTALVVHVVDGSNPLGLLFGTCAFFGVCISNIMLISGLQTNKYLFLVPYFTVCVLFIFALILQLFVDFLESANEKNTLEKSSVLHNGGLLLMVWFEIYMLTIVWRAFVYVCDVNMHQEIVGKKGYTNPFDDLELGEENLKVVKLFGDDGEYNEDDEEDEEAEETTSGCETARAGSPGRG